MANADFSRKNEANSIGHNPTSDNVSANTITMPVAQILGYIVDPDRCATGAADAAPAAEGNAPAAGEDEHEGIPIPAGNHAERFIVAQEIEAGVEQMAALEHAPRYLMRPESRPDAMYTQLRAGVCRAALAANERDALIRELLSLLVMNMRDAFVLARWCRHLEIEVADGLEKARAAIASYCANRWRGYALGTLESMRATAAAELNDCEVRGRWAWGECL